MSDEDGSNETDPLRDLFAHVRPRAVPPEADGAEIRRAQNGMRSRAAACSSSVSVPPPRPRC